MAAAAAALPALALLWLAGSPNAVLWSAQRAPAPGAPEAIGSYSNGCLQGAVALPPSGRGYEALHLGRSRNYGHPELVAFLQRLGATARAKHLGLVVVGDMSQVRGGPTPSGHRSHQTGLDVDVGYAAPPGLRPHHVSRAARERLAPLPVVDLRTHALHKPWGPKVVRLVATAASDPSVDRVFVNPAIKRALCEGPSRREPWLARVRPWWGHHDHFHVRLRCPEGSPLCKAQEPLPEGGTDARDNGCGPGLTWWFTGDAQATQTRRKQTEDSRESHGGPTLPDACAALLDPTAAPAARVSASQ